MIIHSYFSSGEIALETMDPLCKEDRDTVERALFRDPLVFGVAEKFYNDRDMAIIATTLNGLTRFWLTPGLRLDKEIVDHAEKSLPKEHITKKRNREIYLLENADVYLEDCLNKLEGISNAIVKVPLPKRNVCLFIRDSGVARLDGIRLIPHNIEKNKGISAILESIAFKYVDDYYSLEIEDKDNKVGEVDEVDEVGEVDKDNKVGEVGEVGEVDKDNKVDEVGEVDKDNKVDKVDEVNEYESITMYGKGFSRKATDFAMIMGLKYDISFKRAKTCIEGGNCFLFVSNGKQYGLVGNFSLYSSWIALQEQGFFKGSLEECLENGEAAYEVNDLKKEGSEIPLDKLEKADLFEAQLLLTRQAMADDLGISLENLIIIPQTMFHIDMELFVTPDGEVVIHDDGLAIQFIKELHQQDKNLLNRREKRLYKEFLHTAKKRLKEGAFITEERNKILSDAGLTIRFLPSVFHSKRSKICLNYCNGIFLERIESVVLKNSLKRKKVPIGFYYVTTGPTYPQEERLHRRFKELFEQTFPRFSFQGVEKASRSVSTFLGGVRCLTFDTAPL
jgi:hypothetical protein